MSPVADNPVIVPYRYLEDENNPGTLRIRCPLCGWSPRKRDQETDGFVPAGTVGTPSIQSVPCLPSPIDFNPVPQVWQVVAAIGLVCALTIRFAVQST